MTQLNPQTLVEQLSPQERFYFLLEWLKQPVYREPSPAGIARVLENKRDKLPEILEASVPTAIKIMELEEIFHNGGLKGYPGGESLEIQQIETFVINLALLLDESLRRIDDAYLEEQVKKGFDDIQSRLSALASLVRGVKGQRRGSQVERAIQNLKELEQKTMATQTVSRVKPYKIKRLVAHLFYTSVKGPKDLLMERAAELLNQFGISATPEGMREFLKKK